MADELAAPVPSAFPFPKVSEALARLTVQQKLAGAVGIALLLALLIGGMLWTKEPPYAILFANFDERDGGDIVGALQQQNVPYKLSEGGRAILVPQAQVHDVRLKLASAGLPKGGIVGFEIMENQKLGISQFAEQINYQRGLEGELSRSISSLASVQGARVHLAIPKQTAFLRDDLKTSASVVVNLRPGRVLEAAQISGIVHLVSSSVPQLNPLNVSVIDQNGTLLSQVRDASQDNGLDANQRKYVKEIEKDYIKRIESIIAPVVGSRNVRAQVTADIDFSQFDQVAENYKPNPTPETVIRSQQTSETGNGTPGALGVPGALTNQPPAPATAPITQPPVPAGAAGGSAASSNINYARNATINYEVDKTIRHTKGGPGSIRRLSVAIVVNQPLEPDKKSGKPVATPFPDAKLKQINDLAREAMGFSTDRGDTLNIASAAFAPEEHEVIPDTPLWKDAEFLALAKELGRYLLLGVLGFMIWTRLLKPLVDKMTPPPPPPKTEEEENEELVDLEHPHVHDPHHIYEKKIAAARELARKDPKAVAHMIKEWMDGGTAGK
jgi:flagellar M-ring protein FliF